VARRASGNKRTYTAEEALAIIDELVQEDPNLLGLPDQLQARAVVRLRLRHPT
jgi:hypothetical protein